MGGKEKSKMKISKKKSVLVKCWDVNLKFDLTQAPRHDIMDDKQTPEMFLVDPRVSAASVFWGGLSFL